MLYPVLYSLISLYFGIHDYSSILSIKIIIMTLVFMLWEEKDRGSDNTKCLFKYLKCKDIFNSNKSYF